MPQITSSAFSSRLAFFNQLNNKPETESRSSGMGKLSQSFTGVRNSASSQFFPRPKTTADQTDGSFRSNLNVRQSANGEAPAAPMSKRVSILDVMKLKMEAEGQPFDSFINKLKSVKVTDAPPPIKRQELAPAAPIAAPIAPVNVSFQNGVIPPPPPPPMFSAPVKAKYVPTEIKPASKEDIANLAAAQLAKVAKKSEPKHQMPADFMAALLAKLPKKIE
ncbi:hypothetical protein PL78_09725 [Yersinia entomophaga]|uniref:Uncharacterized protein n=1 Tax=Yersinia entomophaga TaxID=935293 RepID=A0ABN4PSQ0_YERET|nr:MULTISPECIES: hypothetical protein [Yersinia]ANI30098.1 hypothetical protein PL78_09725 [Yersinia entomophaga]OWF87622.1 hypothetical protein B4914_10560 [Yersinia entomophaga]